MRHNGTKIHNESAIDYRRSIGKKPLGTQSNPAFFGNYFPCREFVRIRLERSPTAGWEAFNPQKYLYREIYKRLLGIFFKSMNPDPKNTYDLFVSIGTLSTMIAGASFWLASWRSQMVVKELQLKLHEQQLIFREELQRTVDQSNDSFQADVQKSLDNYRMKIGLLKNKVVEIELFLSKSGSYHIRRDPPPDSYPTDFTSRD